MAQQTSWGHTLHMKTVLVFLLLGYGCLAEDTIQPLPITFRYIQTGEFNDQGYISWGTTFWATNHTTNELAVDLSAIECKVGSNWVTQCRLTQPLQFRPAGKPMTQPFLAAHTAGYATAKLSCPPVGTIWRAKAMVAPALTGLSATAAHIRHYPDLLKRRIQSGNTNIPLNPFTTNTTFFGSSTFVLSQEVSEE